MIITVGIVVVVFFLGEVHLVVLIHEVVQQPPFVWSAVSSCHFLSISFLLFANKF